jgi:hypothetical protein
MKPDTQQWIDADVLDWDFNPFHKLAGDAIFVIAVIGIATSFVVLVAAFAVLTVRFIVEGTFPDMMWALRGFIITGGTILIAFVLQVIHVWVLARRWPTPAAYRRWVKDQKEGHSIKATMEVADALIEDALAKGIVEYGSDGKLRRTDKDI